MAEAEVRSDQTAAIGLLICLNLVMHGMTYNKVAKMAAAIKKASRKSAK